MRNKLVIPFIFICGVVAFVSCEKDLPTYLEYEDYAYSSADENGGNWKPILIDEGASINIEAPEDISSQSYQAEI